MENQELEETKKAALASIEATAKSAAENVVTEKVQGLQAEISAKSALIEGLETTIKDLDSKVTTISAEVKKQGQVTVKSVPVENITIEETIKFAILENKEEAEKAFANTSVAIKSVNLEEVKKDITNANWTGTSLTNQTQRVRQTLWTNPYAPIWLKNLFPQTYTDGGSVVIPQVQAYSGGVAVWARGTGSGGADVAKPDVNITFKDLTVSPVWLAGKTRVNRELLMNVSYLASSLPDMLLYSPVGLYAAENKMIVDYLAANAIAYAGDKTVGVEMIVDAAFGQMLGNYLQADYVFLNNFDYVEYIALNKAVGSGEYDLPNGLEVSVIDGSLFINQLRAIPVPSIPRRTAYVIASRDFEFLTRMLPELRMFDQSGDDAEKNKILYRIEEMVTFFTKNLNAAIKITLPTEP